MALSSPRFAGNARLEKAASNKPAMGWGEKGEPVRVIQQALIDLGYWLDISTKKFGTPDGIFGNETFDRVKSFQRSKSLFPDGIVGRLTMDALDKAAGADPSCRRCRTPAFKTASASTRSLVRNHQPLSGKRITPDGPAQYGISW
jgi:peptidoglycan hydrolase-like protein with peptidoglycan-binding domain